MLPKEAEHDTRVDRFLADLSADESGSFGTLFDLYSARLAEALRRELPEVSAIRRGPDEPA